MRFDFRLVGLDAFVPRLFPRIMLFVLVVALYALIACGGGASDGGAAGSGKVTLHWESPTANADGSSLNDLAGFRVYYGRSEPLTKTNAERVNVDKTLTSRLIGALSPGTYFFAVTAVDTSGNESAFSEVVSTDITGI